MWQGAREVSWTPTEFSLALGSLLSHTPPLSERNKEEKKAMSDLWASLRPFDIVR